MIKLPGTGVLTDNTTKSSTDFSGSSTLFTTVFNTNNDNANITSRFSTFDNVTSRTSSYEETASTGKYRIFKTYCNEKCLYLS